MEVDRSGMNRGERALGLDLAEHLARGWSTTATLSSDAERSEIRPARKSPPRGHVAVAARACAARPAATRRSAAVAPALAEDLVVLGDRPAAPRRRRRPGAASGSARCGGRGSPPRPGARGTRRGGGRRTGRARPRRRRRRASPRRAAPGAAPHLPQARDRAGEVGADRRVELADVDPQLERVGRRDGEQVAAGEGRPRSRAAAAACSRRGRGRCGRAGVPLPLGELHRGEPVDQLDPAAALHEADRSHAARSPARRAGRRPRRPPSGGSSVWLVDHRRVPHRDLAPGARRAVVVEQRELGARSAARPARRGWRSSPRP